MGDNGARAMNDDQLLRYSRQIMLPQLDSAGQQQLLDSSVLLIGAGGLGSPIALYLAAAGVGRLIIADADEVDLSNLQRQIAHGTADIGRLKTDSARDRIAALNPDVRVETVAERVTAGHLERLVPQVDLVMDGTDNFATRFAANEACVRHRVPLVSGAATRFEGQVAVFDPRIPDAPCYRCLYGAGGELEESCTQTGVLAPVVGIVGSIQATEALKVLAGIGEPLAGRLLVIDALTMDCRILKLPRDPACPVCGHG